MNPDNVHSEPVGEVSRRPGGKNRVYVAVIPVLPADIAERLKELVGTELSGSAEVYAAIAEIYREFRRITDSA